MAAAAQTEKKLETETKLKTEAKLNSEKKLTSAKGEIGDMLHMMRDLAQPLAALCAGAPAPTGARRRGRPLTSLAGSQRKARRVALAAESSFSCACPGPTAAVGSRAADAPAQGERVSSGALPSVRPPWHSLLD